MSQAKKKFYEEYLKGVKISDLTEEEKTKILIKVKNHFIFYKNITEEPKIKPECLRYKESASKMKALRDLKNELIETKTLI